MRVGRRFPLNSTRVKSTQLDEKRPIRLPEDAHVPYYSWVYVLVESSCLVSGPQGRPKPFISCRVRLFMLSFSSLKGRKIHLPCRPDTSASPLFCLSPLPYIFLLGPMVTSDILSESWSFYFDSELLLSLHQIKNQGQNGPSTPICNHPWWGLNSRFYC